MKIVFMLLYLSITRYLWFAGFSTMNDFHSKCPVSSSNFLMFRIKNYFNADDFVAYNFVYIYTRNAKRIPLLTVVFIIKTQKESCFLQNLAKTGKGCGDILYIFRYPKGCKGHKIFEFFNNQIINATRIQEWN